jgi:hypothetical protein
MLLDPDVEQATEAEPTKQDQAGFAANIRALVDYESLEPATLRLAPTKGL